MEPPNTATDGSEISGLAKNVSISKMAVLGVTYNLRKVYLGLENERGIDGGG